MQDKHTPGPDTWFFPAGLTGDGRKVDQNYKNFLVAVAKI
jgi:hypothetical protein